MSTQRTRMIRLLDRGFYPAELPPPFQTKNFSSVRELLTPSKNYHSNTIFFNGPKLDSKLRTFGIINPISYFLLCEHIAKNWTNIVKIFNLSNCTAEKPKFPSVSTGGRAIRSASLNYQKLEQNRLASFFPIIVNLDINRFYESVYTHSIPWAVLGKDLAKSRYRSNTLNKHWSNELDLLSRNSNDRQTIGLPIGPDTSRIISELVLSRIDYEILASNKVLRPTQIYHNIDDYQIGVYGSNEAEDAQSCFVRAINKYGLRLNDVKAATDYSTNFSPRKFQRHFDILKNKKGRRFVDHFFEILYYEIPKHPNLNVLGYTLRRFARKIARNGKKELVCQYLQILMFKFPHQARWILPLLLGFYKAEEIDTGINELVIWGIENSVRKNDTGTLLWFLYAAIFLRVRLKGRSIDLCLGVSNELVDIMLFHGRSEGLFTGEISALRRRYLDNKFNTSAWLPLYEVERNGWDNSKVFKKIGSDDDEDKLFETLQSNNVEFYLSDSKYFQVEAFNGWKLKEKSFIDKSWND